LMRRCCYYRLLVLKLHCRAHEPLITPDPPCGEQIPQTRKFKPPGVSTRPEASEARSKATWHRFILNIACALVRRKLSHINISAEKMHRDS
jgi:hypothetical protein